MGGFKSKKECFLRDLAGFEFESDRAEFDARSAKLLSKSIYRTKCWDVEPQLTLWKTSCRDGLIANRHSWRCRRLCWVDGRCDGLNGPGRSREAALWPKAVWYLGEEINWRRHLVIQDERSSTMADDPDGDSAVYGFNTWPFSHTAKLFKRKCTLRSQRALNKCYCSCLLHNNTKRLLHISSGGRQVSD